MTPLRVAFLILLFVLVVAVPRWAAVWYVLSHVDLRLGRPSNSGGYGSSDGA